jgi:succinate-semialdehyde dehydrogenase/glutarate-semialdehyde dehydrogenase
MAIESINPANGRLLRHFATLPEDAVRQRISLADDAFRSYATVPLEQRSLWMRQLAAMLEHETEELATTITLEMGKPISAARQEVVKCATACRSYADHAARILALEAVSTGSKLSYVRWDRLGIVLAVMPWNFPFWQVFRFLAPALMAGNVGLLKHSSNVPQCAIAIESLVRRAGFPPGTFQALLIEAKQVEASAGRRAGGRRHGYRQRSGGSRDCGAGGRPDQEICSRAEGERPVGRDAVGGPRPRHRDRGPRTLREQRTILHRRQTLHRCR